MPDPYYSPPATDSGGGLYSLVAAAYVQDLAPVPDPEPSDYEEKAQAAEFLVYKHLRSTGAGIIKSQSARGLSVSYADVGLPDSLIASVMGEYYVGRVAAHNTGYVEDYA